MNLNDLLMQDQVGTFYYKGLRAIPYEHSKSHDKFLILISDQSDREIKLWMSPQSETISLQNSILSAVQWYLLNFEAPKAYPEAKADTVSNVDSPQEEKCND